MTQERRFFTSNQLKVFAMACMLLDHMWATVVPGNEWMTCVGRIAFPIFAFELAEGCRRTHDRRAYALRLLVLALLSEVPFDMVAGGSFVYLFHQNVIFTLLLGLLACRCLDRCRTARGLRRLPPLLGTLGLAAVATLLMTDYGGAGVLLVCLFYLTDGRTWAGRAAQAAGLFYLSQFVLIGQCYTVLGLEIQQECFSLLALPLLWLYNGRRGRKSRPLQLAAYVFYPAHLLVLGALYMAR